MKTLDNLLARFESELVSYKQKREDISTALGLFKALAAVDALVFGTDIAPISISPVNATSDPDSIASYNPSQNGEHDRYVIFVPGIHERIKLKRTTLIFRERGKKVTILAKRKQIMLSELDELYILAAYEVRHRLQHSDNRIRKFNAWNRKKFKDPLISAICGFVYTLFREWRKNMRHIGKSPAFIKIKTNSDEFDSIVIELVLAHRLSTVRNTDDVANILKISAI